jgi:3',5'-cyclic AMP phosphodiesterase CpdA
VVIAQITDPHVGAVGGRMDRLYRTASHLRRAVRHLNALKPAPDAVLATGDLVEHGGVAEYRRLRAILAPLRAPVYLIPGNHDDRDTLRRVFDDHRYLPRTGFIQYTVEDAAVRLVALDTLVPGESGGRLCRDRLAWLDARLADAPRRPTLLFMHHPPFVSGMPVMDGMGLDGADGLADIVRRHPQVERIACGHLHRTITRRFAGTVAITSPATAHQLALDLVPDQRLAVVMDPPACMLHVWLGDAEGLVSHVSLIDSPRPPFTVYDGTRWLSDARPPARFHPPAGRR